MFSSSDNPFAMNRRAFLGRTAGGTLGMLALAVNRGSAADLLRAERHDELLVAPA